MDKEERAVKIFKSGYNCAQAVLTAFCEDYGLNRETALKLAGGFGAGMGRMGEVCGAVTGSFMVLGLKEGQFRQGDKEAKEKTHGLIREFSRQFRDNYGSIKCRDLLGVDLNDPDQLKKATDNGLFHSVCSRYVEGATGILKTLL